MEKIYAKCCQNTSSKLERTKQQHKFIKEDTIHPVFLFFSINQSFLENNYEAQIVENHFFFFLPLFLCRQKNLLSKSLSLSDLRYGNFRVIKMHFNQNPSFTLFSHLTMSPSKVWFYFSIFHNIAELKLVKCHISKENRRICKLYEGKHTCHVQYDLPVLQGAPET